MSLINRVRSWMGVDQEGASSVASSARPPGPPPDAEGLRDALRLVFDPELGIDIVSMGLVRGVEIAGGVARIDMTLSTAGCPVGPLIIGEVEELVRQHGLTPQVELGFDPPWTPDDMEPPARAALGGR